MPASQHEDVPANSMPPGEISFRNKVPNPLLSEKELPTFKFALQKSEGKVIGGSYGKEATVAQTRKQLLAESDRHIGSRCMATRQVSDSTSAV